MARPGWLDRQMQRAEQQMAVLKQWEAGGGTNGTLWRCNGDGKGVCPCARSGKWFPVEGGRHTWEATHCPACGGSTTIVEQRSAVSGLLPRLPLERRSTPYERPPKRMALCVLDMLAFTAGLGVGFWLVACYRYLVG
jgi:hypothetical protein